MRLLIGVCFTSKAFGLLIKFVFRLKSCLDNVQMNYLK